MPWGNSPESIEKRRAYDREQKRKAYERNPEVFKARVRERRAENPDAVRAQDRARYAAEPEKYRAQQRATTAKLAAHQHDLRQIRRAKNWAQFWANGQRRRGVPATPEVVAYVASILDDPCAYCGQRKTRMVIDHIVPISKGGQSTIDNLTRACWPCNDRKRDNSVLQFLMYVRLPTRRQRTAERSRELATRRKGKGNVL